ncbi:unnamed protein product [Acanthosepion pharaonis]|uniref:Uncharacterized protein n=1 Tax=Acanthosepion pharaonis TaxID=158019 RepID=A0A812BGJ6_ACAPH|nr:unnamed protein product [Sepia pharaonis]
MGSALVKDCSKSKTRSFVYRSKRSNESLVAVGGDVVSLNAIHRYLILFHNTKERPVCFFLLPICSHFFSFFLSLFTCLLLLSLSLSTTFSLCFPYPSLSPSHTSIPKAALVSSLPPDFLPLDYSGVYSRRLLHLSAGPSIVGITQHNAEKIISILFLSLYWRTFLGLLFIAFSLFKPIFVFFLFLLLLKHLLFDILHPLICRFHAINPICPFCIPLDTPAALRCLDCRNGY